MKLHRKAQVTLFIILGIIVLTGAGLYLGLRSETVRERLGVGVETVQEVPVEFSPVKFFVEGCIREITEEALRLIGERGGFIDPGVYGFSAADEPTEGGAVEMSPGSDYSVPYWYDMASPNNCVSECGFRKVPDSALYLYKKDGSPSIEGQLEDYINKNLDVCLADFEVLKKQGFSVNKLGDVDTDIKIKDKELSILVNYPLEFSKVSTRKISDFLVKIPFNLKDIYDLAKEIVDLQEEHRYLEKDLLNLIVGFSDVDKNKLPPMHRTVFKFGGKTRWPVEKVKTDLINMLSSYIPVLQVSNTLNYEPIYARNALIDSLYNSGMLVPVSGDYSGLEASFRYHDWWPIYFNINCGGGTCGPESVSTNIMSIVGVQIYSMVYDVSFPVLVEIRDPSAFNNRGYSFYFFMESNVRNNNIMSGESLPLQVIAAGDSMLCDVNKRNTGDITVSVLDSDGYELDDAEVFLTAGGDTCNIGKTEDGVLVSRFPPSSGYVSVIKEGYLGKSLAFDGYIDEADSLDFRLNPIFVMPFIVKKKLIEKKALRWDYVSLLKTVDLKENETAILKLERISEAAEEEFQTSAVYLGNQTGASEIRITPGKYKVTIQLLLEEEVLIPGRKVGGFMGFGEKKIPAVPFPAPYISGGLIANYTISAADLADSDTITFYVLSHNLYDIPESARRIEDVEEVMDFERTSRLFASTARPEFR